MKYFKITICALCFLGFVFLGSSFAFAESQEIGDLLKKQQEMSKKDPETEPYRPPVLAASAIIEIYEKRLQITSEPNTNKNEVEIFKGIVLIKRRNPPFGQALPGGKVEYGESVEEGIRREMREELGLELEELRQFHVYSAPDRDPRRHTVDVTFIAKSHSKPKAGDDAAGASVHKLDELPQNLTFDHRKILDDYLDYRKGKFEVLPLPSK